MMRRKINKNNYLGKLASFDRNPPEEEEEIMDSNEFYAQQVEKPKLESRSVLPQEEPKIASEESNMKIAQEPTSAEQALINVDEAFDLMIVAIQAIEDNLKDIATETDEEKNAIKKIQELMDSAIAPYLSDIFKEMQVFDK